MRLLRGEKFADVAARALRRRDHPREGRGDADLLAGGDPSGPGGRRLCPEAGRAFRGRGNARRLSHLRARLPGSGWPSALLAARRPHQGSGSSRTAARKASSGWKSGSGPRRGSTAISDADRPTPEAAFVSPRPAGMTLPATPEHERLQGQRGDLQAWRRWGPYVSERAWGTVREDYSPDGSAWDYFPHDLARSKAYRWGEDGLAGPLRPLPGPVLRPRPLERARPHPEGAALRPRPCGGEPRRGREGALVLPRLDPHPLLHEVALQVPAAGVPLRAARARRTAGGGAARGSTSSSTPASSTTTATSTCSWSTRRRGPRTSRSGSRPGTAGRRRRRCTCCPTCGSATPGPGARRARPSPTSAPRTSKGHLTLTAEDRSVEPLKGLPFLYRLGARHLYMEEGGRLLFTGNETNAPRVYGPWAKSRRPYVKDAFHRFVVNGEKDAVNPDEVGTKACGHYRFVVPPGESVTLKLRLTDQFVRVAPGRGGPDRRGSPGRGRRVLRGRPARDRDRGREARAAAGPGRPALGQADLPLRRGPLARRRQPRTSRLPPRGTASATCHWRHLNSMRVISMPDKWEYPWFAAWDLAFHAVSLAFVDPRFRQGAALDAALRAVPAPERPDPRLRVGVLRREPAGARLGGLARLQHGPHPQRKGPTGPSWSAASTSCSSTSPGG